MRSISRGRLLLALIFAVALAIVASALAQFYQDPTWPLPPPPRSSKPKDI